jgi:DNA polymerase-3 subunit epsilon
MELKRVSLAPLEKHCITIIDSLPLARKLYPGKKNSLDALCARLEVENSHRTYHGALLDSELLAQVYLKMTGGQESLCFDNFREEQQKQGAQFKSQVKDTHPVFLTNEEKEAHHRWIEKMEKDHLPCLFKDS